MNTRHGIFVLMITAALFLHRADLAAQDFSRKLELRRERMNGADVRALQERLLRSGFTGIGEADGYYGPRTEKAIRDIQRFAGFEETGSVDRPLWEFIFTDSAGTVALISRVAAYDKNKLRSIEGSNHYDYWGSLGYNFTLYFSNDGRLKILAIEGGNGDAAYSEVYYLVSDDQFIAIRQYNHVHGDSRYDVYIRNGGSTGTNGYAASYRYEDNQKHRVENYEPDFSPDDTLLAILYSLQFGG